MTDHRGDAEAVYFFREGHRYLAKHYFESEHVFEELREYYVHDDYRFEVPTREFDDVEAFLREESYGPVVVEELEPYCVVVEAYQPYADVLRNAVETWEREGHRFFVMKDELSVEQATERGATRLAETDLAL